MSQFIVHLGVDLPASGDVPPEDCYGPTDDRAKGEVARVHGEGADWLLRLERGSLTQNTVHRLSDGSVLLLNIGGNVYWIRPGEKAVKTFASRWHSFSTEQIDGRSVVAFDFADVCLIDETGLRWKRKEVAEDDLSFQGAEGQSIVFRGWRTSPDDLLEIRLSLLDGSDLAARPVSP